MISESVALSASICADIVQLIHLWPDQQERKRSSTVWQQLVDPEECWEKQKIEAANARQHFELKSSCTLQQRQTNSDK